MPVFQLVHPIRVCQKLAAHGGALDAPAGELLLHEIGVVQAADPTEGHGGILPHLVAELEEAPRLTEIGMAGRVFWVLMIIYPISWVITGIAMMTAYYIVRRKCFTFTH